MFDSMELEEGEIRSQYITDQVLQPSNSVILSQNNSYCVDISEAKKTGLNRINSFEVRDGNLILISKLTIPLTDLPDLNQNELSWSEIACLEKYMGENVSESSLEDGEILSPGSEEGEIGATKKKLDKFLAQQRDDEISQPDTPKVKKPFNRPISPISIMQNLSLEEGEYFSQCDLVPGAHVIASEGIHLTLDLQGHNVKHMTINITSQNEDETSKSISQETGDSQKSSQSNISTSQPHEFHRIRPLRIFKDTKKLNTDSNNCIEKSFSSEQQPLGNIPEAEKPKELSSKETQDPQPCQVKSNSQSTGILRDVTYSPASCTSPQKRICLELASERGYHILNEPAFIENPSSSVSQMIHKELPLRICDIKKVQSHNNLHTVFGHRTKQIILCGSVTPQRIINDEKRTQVYKLDDGTGMVEVFYSHITEQHTQVLKLLVQQRSTLAAILRTDINVATTIERGLTILEKTSKISNCVKLGDKVEVVGKLKKRKNGTTYMIAMSFLVTNDPLINLNQMAHIETFYESVYKD